MKHIPHGAIDKTDYVRSLGIYTSQWFVFDGRVYSSNEKSIWNGTNWMEFCEINRNFEEEEPFRLMAQAYSKLIG